MRFLKTAEKVAAVFEVLSVHPQKCAKVCSNLSKCKKCQDVCPVNGIEFHDEEMEITSCIECGLCAMKCPTGALKWEKPSIDALLDEIHQFISQKEPVFLHCQHHQPGNHFIHTIQVPCLGAITKELWHLMLTTTNQFQIYWPTSACMDCPVTPDEEIHLEELLQAEASYPERKIAYTTKLPSQVGEEETLDRSRRNWLSGLIRSVKRTPATLVDDWVSQSSNKVVESKWISPRKRTLKSILKRNPKQLEKFIIQIPTINENCTFCTACSKLCPNKALTQENGTLSVDLLLCTECGLCRDICYFKGIELQTFSATELLVSDLKKI